MNAKGDITWEMIAKLLLALVALILLLTLAYLFKNKFTSIFQQALKFLSFG